MTFFSSKFAHASPFIDQKETTVANFLVKDWLINLQIPKRIHGVQGRNFESFYVFKNCVITTTLKNPTQHLNIPRGTDSVRDLIESCMIDCGQNHQKRSGLNIPYLVYIKDATVYSSTGYSP